MMKFHKLEVVDDEKEVAIKFLHKSGFTTKTTFIGTTWYSDKVWEVTWYADDLFNHKLELIEHLQYIRKKNNP